MATLPDRRQRVQTRTVLWVPLPTTARTDWRLGLKRRWVTLWARTTIAAAGLPRAVKVEIDVIAGY